MSKIKVGDKIRSRVTCVFREKNFITWNKIYEVANITDCETGYQVVNDVNELMIFKMCNFDKEFELVEQKTDFVVDKVIQKFSERSQIGIEKYGKTLAENNTDNFLNHLQEKLMDAVNHIEKLKTQESSELFDNIRKWFDDKELIKQENAPKQMMKVMEELPEYPVNLGTAKGVPIREIVELISKIFKVEIKYVPVEGKIMGAKSRVMERNYGNPLTVSLEEGLKEIYEYVKKL